MLKVATWGLFADISLDVEELATEWPPPTENKEAGFERKMVYKYPRARNFLLTTFREGDIGASGCRCGVFGFGNGEYRG